MFTCVGSKWPDFNFSDPAKMQCRFGRGDFAVWAAPTSLKPWIEMLESMRWQCLQYFQIYIEIFLLHLATAVPLLETDNIWTVCWYFTDVRPVLMACNWKSRCILFVPTCLPLSTWWWLNLRAAPFSYQLHLLLLYLLNARNRAEWPEPSRFPLHSFSFAQLVPSKQLEFWVEPSHYLLCATMLDIISTGFAYLLLLKRALVTTTYCKITRS